jgi:hypothetical protein
VGRVGFVLGERGFGTLGGGRILSWVCMLMMKVEEGDEGVLITIDQAFGGRS